MATSKTASSLPNSHGQGLRTYYQGKIEEYEVQIREKQVDLRRMEAQRNELNTKGTPLLSSYHHKNVVLYFDFVCSSSAAGGIAVVAGTWILCWRGDQIDGKT